MVTIKEVAVHAGVSMATVSRVLNGNTTVAPELRERVLASVAALDFQPSAVARSLRSQQTRTIGLIVPDNRNPFFAEIARGIESYCYGVGYNVYLCNSADDGKKEFEYCQNLYQQRADGVILCVTGTSDKGLLYLQERRMPVVLVDRAYPTFEVGSVQCDHYDGALQAMDYLFSLGHRHFGLIIGQRHHFPVQDRLRACMDFLESHHCSSDSALLYETHGYAHEEGFQSAYEMFSSSSPPTAIFAFNDMLAIGALRFALENNIQVPQQLSIVGVDNIPSSAFVTPSLTTVAQPMFDLGSTAAKLLINKIQDNSSENVQKIFSPRLIIRESTGQAPLARE